MEIKMSANFDTQELNRNIKRAKTTISQLAECGVVPNNLVDATTASAVGSLISDAVANNQIVGARPFKR